MKILRSNSDLNLIVNTETDFLNDLGREENLQQFEGEVLNDVINPLENYETIRYIHKPYTGITSNTGDTQCDIWFYFYFLSGSTYVQDYSPVDISPLENELLLRQSTDSFFSLEFYKTPISGNTFEPPTRTNRKLVFTKNLSIPLGEKFFYPTLNGYIHIPIFTGSNYRNKENMYLFWFEDESVLSETNLSGTTTGNTFFMTAKFYNAKDGSITDFTNSGFTSGHTVSEQNDMYYQVNIDKIKHTYEIFKYTGGTSTTRYGIVNNGAINPIKFFEKGGGNILLPPILTPTITPVVTQTQTQTPTPTPTLTPSKSPNPLGVSSIMLSSGTTIEDACTGLTQTYYYSSNVNFGTNGTAIFTNTQLTTPAPGSNGFIRYYYSYEYNNIYYIDTGDGKKYNNPSYICPTPTPTTGTVLNAVVSLVDGLTACAGGDYDTDPLDPTLNPMFFDFTIYGSNIVNASAIINIPSFLLADFTTNQEFYVRGRVTPDFYWKKFILDGDPSNGVNSATASGAAVLCQYN